MNIEGTIRPAEGARWAAKACGRLTGYPWSLVLTVFITLLGVGVAIVLAAVLTILFDELEALGTPIMIVLAIPATLLAARIVQKINVSRFRKALAVRGVPMDLPTRIEILPEGWSYGLGEVTTLGPWSAISEVFPTGPYWILMNQGSLLYVPKRYFDSAEAERAFVAEVLTHLSPEAVARSQAAVKRAATA
ncbi:MAG: YcxB family protein [Caulobacteraceae bacterium]|nr:YcxB family protein [Caulobacteraceae bacterium]